MPAAQPPARKPAPRGRTPSRDPLIDRLAQAAWAEADEALARALIDADALAASLGAAPESVVDAMQMLAQSLGQAARKRGLARFGAVGARVAYDERLHALMKPAAKPPGEVRIVMPGVMRGEAVLIKAQARPARARRRS